MGQTTVFVDARSDPKAPLTAGTPNRYALVTHHHGDHFDPQALKSVFNDNSYAVCQREVAPWLNPQGLYVQTAETYQPVFLSRGSGDVVAFSRASKLGEAGSAAAPACTRTPPHVQ